MDAMALHRDSIVFDGHCDRLLSLLPDTRTLGERSAEGHIDLPRLREGHVTAQVLAIFIDEVYLPASTAKRMLRLLDTLYRELADNRDSLLLALNAADIERAKKEGMVAAVVGLEGAESVEGDLSPLPMFHRLGVRLPTVAWSRRDQAAYGVYEARTGGWPHQFRRAARGGVQ